MNQVPTFDELLQPLFNALKDLGGSGSISEIEEKVAEILNVPEAILEVPHNPEKSNQTEFQYRLAWARTYLKQCEFIDNSTRGVWAIIPEKRHIEKIDAEAIVQRVRDMHKARRLANDASDADTFDDAEIPTDENPDEALLWRENLHSILTNIPFDAFERLAMRILRESGFVQVEVTGKSGDCGIDGKGIARLSGMLSFHVIFQCKRYRGSVSASEVRDFRGAMVGRADKGLFITTGTFSPAAIREGTRDGAPAIDMIDGDQLADKLKELGLGIKTEVVEKITVEKDWFSSL